MGDAGFGANRVPVNWAGDPDDPEGALQLAVTPISGVYNSPSTACGRRWSSTGRRISSTRARGRGSTAPRARRDLKAWRKFSEALARRYSPNGDFFDAVPEIDNLPVKNWIAWNEQNSKNNWAPKPDPRAYGKLVKAFDEGISKVDPKAQIVLGGMYGFPRDSKSMKATKFLKRLYKVKGIAKHFDAINSHPYGSGRRRRQAARSRTCARSPGGPATATPASSSASSAGPRRDRRAASRSSASRARRSGSARASKLLVKKRKAWNILGAYVYSGATSPTASSPATGARGRACSRRSRSRSRRCKAVTKVIRKNR